MISKTVQDHLNQLAATREANKENKECHQHFQAGFDSRQPEIDALQKDAARYRYLRVNLHRLQGMRPNHAPEPEALDFSIDEELKENP